MNDLKSRILQTMQQWIDDILAHNSRFTTMNLFSRKLYNMYVYALVCGECRDAQQKHDMTENPVCHWCGKSVCVPPAVMRKPVKKAPKPTPPPLPDMQLIPEPPRGWPRGTV